MQFSLLISHCNIRFLLFWLSQGSVETLIRWGAWSSYRHMYRSSLILTVKTALKSVVFFTKLQTKISLLLFYGSRCIDARSVLQKHVEISSSSKFWCTFTTVQLRPLTDVICSTTVLLYYHQPLCNHFMAITGPPVLAGTPVRYRYWRIL